MVESVEVDDLDVGPDGGRGDERRVDAGPEQDELGVARSRTEGGAGALEVSEMTEPEHLASAGLTDGASRPRRPGA